MDSTAKPAPAGADDLLLAGGDTKPSGDYERVVREELARVQERLAQLAPSGAAAAAAPQVKIAPDGIKANMHANTPDATMLDANVTAFRASAVNGPSRKRGVARVLTALLLAGTIVGAGAAWAAYGDAVKPLITSSVPEIGEMWSQVSDRFGLASRQSATDTPTAPADPAAPPTTPPQVAASQAVAPPAAAPEAAPASADVGQMLQGMARDIASLQQGIEQLKAGQEQMARDNAKLAEQLKASQEQLTRVMARASEQNLHPRPPPAPPKPLATAARRPMPAPVSTLPPPQAIAPPPQAAAAPVQLPAEDTSLPGVPRPPKPVP